jgi:hypothetical protein
MSSDQSRPASPWQPAAALPDPTAASGPTRWTEPAADYAGRADGASSWADVPAPAAVPPVVAEGPQTRPGWLLAARGDG